MGLEVSLTLDLWPMHSRMAEIGEDSTIIHTYIVICVGGAPTLD